MKVFEESTEKVTFGNKHGSNGGPTINSKTASVLSNFMKTNKQLQEHIAQLSRQNHELKLLEKLRPQLMELQHRITVLQDESFQFRTKSIEEIAQLTDRVQELTTQLRSANRNVEAAQEELKEVKSYADTLAARSEALKQRELKLEEDIERITKEKLAIEARAIDPEKLKEVENQLAEVIGEREKDVDGG